MWESGPKRLKPAPRLGFSWTTFENKSGPKVVQRSKSGPKLTKNFEISIIFS